MNQWIKVVAPNEDGRRAVLPPVGQTVALYMIRFEDDDNKRTAMDWIWDIGTVYVSETVTALLWASAFGCFSALDGLRFLEILMDYDAYFCPVPSLPSPSEYLGDAESADVTPMRKGDCQNERSSV